jgi:hypothetical protein
MTHAGVRGRARQLAAIAGLSLIAALALQAAGTVPVGAAAGSPVPYRSHPLIPGPSPSGSAESTIRELGWSASNWSGYDLTAGGYRAITGCWTVPSVTAAGGDPTHSSAWIGIDGGLNGDDYLIQTGTEQDWSGGSAQYSAWWEILTPSEENPATTIPSMTIHAGDAMCASITKGTGGNWTIALHDTSTGTHVSTVQAFAGPGESAEWILERPVVCDPTCALSTLADYGQTTFETLSVNGANPELVAAEGGLMLDCDPSSCTGAPVISTPSNPDAAGNGFTVAYGPNQPPAPLAPTAYAPLQPYRICDTRSVAITGYSTECSGSPLGQGQSMNVQVTGVDGPAGASQSVPSDAQSVVLNVTAIFGTAGTFLTVFPAGDAVPTASNLNVNAGTNQANLVVVALGTGGQVSIYNSQGSINVAVDVQGYFAAPSGSSSVPGLFHPISPLRICDTRKGTETKCSGTSSDNLLGANQWTRVVVSGCPTGIPSCTASVPTDGTAEAVALNLTAVFGSAGTFLSVVPPNSSDQCPTGYPAFSNLNVNAGYNLPNRVIVPLGPEQDVCVYNNQGAINFILDVNGWFGNGEDTQGASYYAISPLRLCDTRSAGIGYTTECSGESLGTDDTLTIPVAGVDGLPASGGSSPPVAVIANVTAVFGTAFTFFTLYPSDVSLPNASDLNVGSGQNTPNLSIVELATTGASAGDLDLFNDQGSINAIVDVEGWFA